MKIAVLGETTLPVLSHGPGGLGRMTYEHATEFVNQGHKIFLYSPQGGDFGDTVNAVQVFSEDIDPKNYDVVFDCSHNHDISKRFPDAPILNLIGDRQCMYLPPNAVVESQYMKNAYPSAKIISAGIDTSKIPLHDGHGEYLIFMGLNCGHKQPNLAKEVAYQSGRDIVFIGPGFEIVKEREEKWEILGNALGLLCPYTIDASPRAPLEAAACGVPTLCLDVDGTQDHVVHGRTGYICKDRDVMVEHTKDLNKLDRDWIRNWVIGTHDIKKVIEDTLELMDNIRKGDRW